MHRIFTPALLVTLAACDPGRSYDSTPPAFDVSSPLSPTEQALLDEAGIVVLQPASGQDAAHGGVLYVPSPLFPGASLAFTAIGEPDGSAKGEYEYRETDAFGSTIRIHGEVQCLNVTGNIATFGGPITQHNLGGDFPPVNATFTVVDRGEPNGEGLTEGDLASRAFFEIPICTETSTERTDEGNIQVREGEEGTPT